MAAPAAHGSIGEFGWSGAANIHFWVDPKQEVVAVFMTQSLMSFDVPKIAMRAVVNETLE